MCFSRIFIVQNYKIFNKKTTPFLVGHFQSQEIFKHRRMFSIALRHCQMLTNRAKNILMAPELFQQKQGN